MDKHQTVLGALFLALGLMGSVGMAAVFLIFFVGSALLGTVVTHEPDFPAFLTVLPLGLGLFICLAIAVGSIPALIAGYGLLLKRSWACIWSLIAGVLSLPNVPFGTGIGIYAIWFFVQDETGAAPTERSG